MERSAAKAGLAGKALAVAVPALAGLLACGAFAGASATGAPAPGATSAPSSSTAFVLVWPPLGGGMPAAMLVPVVYAPADLVAPSYAGWMTGQPQGAPAGVTFAASGKVTADGEALHRTGVVPTPPPRPAALPMAAALPMPAAVPLPPKRLAEKRASVVAALEPSPPPPPLSFAPPPAAPELAVPTEAAVPDEAAAPAPTAELDPARPIDDTPETTSERLTAERAPPHIEALIQRHAERFDVPADLVRRVAWRESKFDPRRRNGPYWGLMQIRVDTARGLGFRGAPKDLLDADTNMTYAVAYLANAYRVAGRDQRRAVTLYAKGYYYEAKRKGVLGSLIRVATVEE